VQGRSTDHEVRDSAADFFERFEEFENDLCGFYFEHLVGG